MNELSCENTEWSTKYLSNAKIPSLALNSDKLQHPDWSQDITKCENNNDWALTFSGGPSKYTPKLLKILDSRNVKATFFVIGSEVARRNSILKQVADAGHEIGISSWSFSAFTTLKNEVIVSEIEFTRKLVKRITGTEPTLLRTPYGDVDPRVRAIAKAMNMTLVYWNYDSRDTMGSKTVVKDMIQRTLTRDGTISVQHDFKPKIVCQAPCIIDAIINAGFNVKTVSQCAANPVTVDAASTTTQTTTTTSVSLPVFTMAVKTGVRSSAISDTLRPLFYILVIQFLSFSILA